VLYSPLCAPEDAIRLLKLYKICLALPKTSNTSQPEA
jgi:hypothetical protein